MEEFAQTDSWRMMQISHPFGRWHRCVEAPEHPAGVVGRDPAAIRNSREDHSKLGMSSPAIAALTEADEGGGREPAIISSRRTTCRRAIRWRGRRITQEGVV